jgi:hypothetical protein
MDSRDPFLGISAIHLLESRLGCQYFVDPCRCQDGTAVIYRLGPDKALSIYVDDLIGSALFDLDNLDCTIRIL